jgi:23S rRNA pseudouridine1911/1915/1917 synthase
MSSRHIEFEISEAEAGLRLDRLLGSRAPELGRKRIAELFALGLVTVDGRRARKGDLGRAWQRVSAEAPASDSALAAPDAPLEVLLERDDLVIVNKPAGQPSAALHGSAEATTAGALLARYPEMASVGFGAREPGLVHRLDTQTSGALMAARTQPAFLNLRKLVEAGELDKRYLALVEAHSIDDAGVVDVALGPHHKNARKVSALDSSAPGARAARSEYRVLERGPRFALVEVLASRAYRHQVRVHLAWRGSPIAGDELYGGATVGLGPRHALHASYVAGEGEGVPAFAVTAPLPEDMALLLRSR